MSDGEFVFVYSEASAKAVAGMLVDARLAACVNIHSPMTSVYEWQGSREAAAEVAVFIKTRRALADAAIAAAKPLHPHTVPCFLILPVESGNADYLAWLREQTRRQ